MAAILLLGLYLAAGLGILSLQCPRLRPLDRLWIGLTLGLALMMWLPALCALGGRFSLPAQGKALFLLGGLFALSWATRSRQKRKGWDEQEQRMVPLLLVFVLPLLLLSFFLQYTHVLRPVDGALHVGQSTYGDLNLHLGIATSLRDATFPPMYSILPDTKLSYPFLADALSTTLMLCGLPLRWSVILPGTLMMGLIYLGFLLLCRRMIGSGRRVMLLAGLFFFLNGGLGFLHDFDMAGKDFSRVQEIFTGFYKTPANQPDLNLRWSNVIVDLMLPQRTLTGGWLLVMPAMYFLFDAFDTGRWRSFVWVALFASALPWVHTHSFLALGLMSAGCSVYGLLRRQTGRERKRLLLQIGLYLGITLVFVLPQLLDFAVAQTLEGGALRLQFNWVNNSRNQGMIDGYFWFWIKNVGIPFVLLLCALLDLKRERRLLAAGAFAIFLVAEFVLFQPNEYDNNKLFYIWAMPCMMLAAEYAVALFDRLWGFRGRYLLAGLGVLCSVLSGSLSIAREVVSDYQLFHPDAVACAEYVENETPREAVFLTGTQHVNPISALAGRRIVCGPDLYLFFHGLDYRQNQADCERFYEDPIGNLDVLARYDVSYIVVGDYEVSDYDVDLAALDARFARVYESDYFLIYQVAPGDKG